jgi:sterol desaturase/sphingolipid hydroxylase (fatty acid hydroxylase superfamily)
MIDALPRWIVPASAAGAFVVLACLETWRPLRVATRGKARRWGRNLATGALAAAVVAPLQSLLVAPVVAACAERRIGMLHWLASSTWREPSRLPRWVEIAVAVLLLDWTLWLWHRANHRIPFLWRFHLVHHVDPDLDASTGLRFHFGEMALSVPYRALQIAVIGAPASAVTLWTAALFVSIFFHHSNWRLPIGLERGLVRVLVTPRMHGIHHSTIKAERDTNYSSLLSVWDRLHGTLLLGVPQQEIRIGVPELLEAKDGTIGRITALPFGRAARAGVKEAAAVARVVGRPTALVE